MTLYQQQERQAEQNNSASITDILVKQTREMVTDQKRLSERINGVTGLDLTPDEYSMISVAMANSKNPDETANRFAQALTYSHNSGITFEEAYANLDALNYNQLGKKVDVTQTGTKAVINSFKIGKLTVQRQRIAQETYKAYQNGMDLASIFASKEASEIEALDNEIASLQDYMPRAWYTEIAKGAANTLSYSFNVLAAAAAGKALGAAAGSNPVGAGLATLFSFLEGYQLTKYGNWYDNVKAGVDPKVADAIQTVSAGIQAAIESYLDINVGLVKSLGTGTAKSIASSTVKNMYVNGTLNKVGMFLTKYAINMASEGTEELLQEITDEVFDNIAFSLSGKEAPNDLKDIISNSAKAFLGGASAAIILGIGDAAYETKMNVKYAQNLKNEAIANPSKETFVNNHIDDEELGTASRKDRAEILSTAYDNTRQAAQNEGITVSEAKTIDTDYNINDDFEPGEMDGQDTEPKASEQPVEPIKRMDDGRLRVQESTNVTQNTDGTESHTLNIGSRGSSTRYGHVDYTIDTQNKTITIDQVATRLGYEDLTRDAILEVERTYEGWNIEWNPETAAQQAIKEQMINDSLNPNKGNLQWFKDGSDVDANIRVGEWVKKTFKNLTTEQSIVAARLLEVMAESQGKDAKTWIDDHIQGLQAFAEEGKKGAVSFDESGIKAIIYAGENADFSTFSHETFHVLVRTAQSAAKLADAFKSAANTAEFAKYVNSHKQIIKMDLDEVLDAVKDMGEDPMNWTRAQHEVAATFFESYLRDGKTFNEKLKNIFRQIADWFHRIYKALRGENSLNDEIVKAYDEILAGNPELARSVETAESNAAQANVSSAIDENEDNGLDEYGNPLYQSESYEDTDEYKETEAALRADKSNFDSEGNHLAPNGNKSNLSYSQWVLVRTKPFMDWFGDWINDAKNASKAVDENGEPKVFLHGSVEQFDTFDKSKIKANETDAPFNGFWFTDKELIASPAFRTRQYLSEFFLNVRNPAEYTTRGLYKLDKELIRELWDEKTQNWNPQSRSTQDEMRYRLQAEGYDGVWFAKRPDLSSQEGQKLVKWTTARGRKMSLHLKEDGYYYLYEGWDEDSDAFVTGGWKTATEYANQLEENTLVVFEPNQIKSATDNNGEFNPDDTSILYQRASSAGTSVMNQIPAAYGAQRENLREWAKKKLGINIYAPGQTNFEQGMGRSDTATEHLKSLGITNIGTDPFNRSREFNIENADKAMQQKVDTSSAMNVLNVIDDDSDMELVIAQSALPLKEGGAAIFQVYEGDKSGKGQYKVNGTQYQRNMKGADYVPYIKKYYSDVAVRGNTIVALNPKMDSVMEVTDGKFSFNDVEPLYQSEWHGSPADFEQFDTSHIGEGEGNQVFGWGIYLSSSKTIAKDYADRLAKKHLFYNGVRIEPNFKMGDHLSYAAYILSGNDYSLTRAKTELKSKVAACNRLLKDKEMMKDAEFKAVTEQNKQFFSEVYTLLTTNADSFKIRPIRNLYNVDIPDDNGHNYIYWDKEYEVSELKDIIEAAKKQMPLEEQKYFIEDYGFKSGYITGQNLYNTLSLAFGRDDKRTSLFLRDHGYVGINYPAGTLSNRKSEARNFVIFSGEDIAINDHTLYQLDSSTESSLMAEAKDFESKEEFIQYERAFDLDDMSYEDLSEVWDKAHGVYQTQKEEYVSPISENMSDEDKDEAFRVIMASDEGITAFINRLREAFAFRSDVRRNGGAINVFSDEDYNDVVQAIANADRVETEAAPYITALAKSRKDITPEAINKVRGMINNSLRDYRDLYSQILGDENFAAGTYSEYMPDIKDARANGMRITQRKDLANRLEGELIREQVRRGTEKYDGTAEKVMAVYEKELKDLNDEYEKLKEKYDKTYLKMSVAEANAFKKLQQIKKMESALTKERQNVRQKLDSDRRIPSEQLSKIKTWEEQLDLLHEEVKELRKQDAVKATVKRREALDNLREQIRQKQKEKAAVEAVHRYKRDLFNSIVEKVPNNVDYSYVQKIQEVIATIQGVQGYQNNTIWVDGKKLSLEDFRKKVESGEVKVEGLSDYQLKRYLNTSLADLTISDLETLKDTVDYYKLMGKQMWQAKVDQRNFEANMLRQQALKGVYFSKKYDPENDHLTGSAESDKTMKKNRLRGGFYKTLNWNRKAQILDNGQKGINYDLTVEERRVHQDEQLRAVRDRVNPVKAIMDESGLKEADFYKTVPIVFPDGKVENWRVGTLIYGMLADRNERNLYAVSYGNLVSQSEKENMSGTADQVNQDIMRLGNARYKAFKAQAEAFFAEHPEYQKVIDAVVADWNSEENLARIQKVLIEEYNKPMEVEGFYMTMHRQDFNGTESAYRLQDDMYNLNAGKSKTTPNSGFKESRIDISPLNQQPVDMDFFRVWLQSVEDQENVIANLAYVRKLNRVYKNYGSKGLRSAIENAYGSAMTTDLDNYINEVANSSLFSDTQEINGIVGKLRGQLYTAYLGYKMSGIVLQGITSPMPSLQEVNPAQLAKGLLQMTFHPVSTWKFICERSPYMEHRSMNPAIENIKKFASQYTDSKMKAAYRKFLEFGTSGLEAVDRWAVSGSWLAVYDKKLRELGSDTAENIKAAAHYADNFIRDTQPTGDITEIAPLFKSKNAFAQAFTQFQVSLNVIWNNVTYDLPQAVKKHEFAKAAGIVFGYALAGMLLNLAQEGYDEDDEPEDIAKQLIYAATTQFTQSTPLLGSIVDGAAKSLITGESGFTYNTNQLYPGISNITTGLNQMLSTDKKTGERKGLSASAVKNITKGVALMAGFPTSGASELWDTFFDKSFVEAVNEGDMNFKFNPGALLGRRDY